MLTHAGICIGLDNPYSNSSIKQMKVQFLTIVSLPGDTKPCIFIEGILSTPTLPLAGESIGVPDKEDEYSFLNRGLSVYSTDFGSYEVIEVDHLFERKGVLRPRINFEVTVEYGYELESNWERLSLLSAENLKLYLSDKAVKAFEIDKVKEFGYQDEEAEMLIEELIEKLPTM